MADPVIDPLPPAAPPYAPQFEALTVKEDSVMGIRLDSTVTSETARVEDKVSARVTRDLTVDGRTAIPSGARLEGVVSVVERGGKFKDRSRLGIKFQSLLLPDGTRMPIQTETISGTANLPRRRRRPRLARPPWSGVFSARSSEGGAAR